MTVVEFARGRSPGGRPRKNGKRFPSGGLRPEPEPMSGVLWQRIVQFGRKVGVDQRMNTELGRLYWIREFTTLQAVTGARVAEIYGRYEGSQGIQRRHAVSPNYDGHRNGSRQSDDEAVASAKEAWERLQAIPLHYQTRGALERLCVDNESINPVLYSDVRRALDKIASVLRIENTGPAATSARPVIPLHFNAHKR